MALTKEQLNEINTKIGKKHSLEILEECTKCFDNDIEIATLCATIATGILASYIVGLNLKYNLSIDLLLNNVTKTIKNIANECKKQEMN